MRNVKKITGYLFMTLGVIGMVGIIYQMVVPTEIEVPIYQQYPHAMNACEAYSLTQALHAKGYAMDRVAFDITEELPEAVDGNPFFGFAGNRYENTTEVATIYPNALLQVAQKYAPNSFVPEHYSINDLKKEIKKGHPVLIWGTLHHFEQPKMHEYWFGQEPTNGHTMVLCGYDGSELLFADPVYGRYWQNQDVVEEVYQQRGYKALVIQ